MEQVRNLIGAQGAAAARVVGPAEYTGLEERAIKNQLPTTLEQVEQTDFARGPFELVLLPHQHPRHAPALCGERITGAGESLLLDEELLPRSIPLLLRHDGGCLHFVFGSCHIISPLLCETEG